MQSCNVWHMIKDQPCRGLGPWVSGYHKAATPPLIPSPTCTGTFLLGMGLLVSGSESWGITQIFPPPPLTPDHLPTPLSSLPPHLYPPAFLRSHMGVDRYSCSDELRKNTPCARPCARLRTSCAHTNFCIISYVTKFSCRWLCICIDILNMPPARTCARPCAFLRAHHVWKAFTRVVL